MLQRTRDQEIAMLTVRPFRVLTATVLVCVCQIACAADVESSAPAPVRAKDPVMSPFGIGSSAMRSRDQAKWMPQMADIGVCDLRSCCGGWGAQPAAGTWDWTLIDARLDYLDSIGVTGGILFNGLGKWNTVDQKGGLPLNSLPEWSTMVGEVVKHTKGRVSHFECWNEPPNGTKNAPASDYAKVVVATYDAAKAANPDALVGMAAKSAHINYLDQAIKAGAKGHFDYITLHPYEVLGTIIAHPGTEPLFLSIVPTVRKMLKAQDPAKVDVPVILTEVGYDVKHGKLNLSGVELQAHAVLKVYVMGMAQGMTCIQWFEGMDGDSGPLGLLDNKGNKRPSYHALANLIKLLGRHPTYLGWVMFNDRHYGFVFQGVSGPVLATWAATIKPEEVEFGQDVQIMDPPTGTVTTAAKQLLSIAPILVSGVPDRLVVQAKANLGKPIPWGGDYSAASAVSVTFGETYEEKGLHTMAADSIAADVIAYGGNARAGEMPKGGNVYVVDPNYLSYDTVPIEITALVKRNAKGDKANLSLEYESTTGYKKPAAFDIPEDTTQWHKATWTIDDCQFVNTWAFSFRFAQGKYALQSVTVTKLGK
jgi:polysaccharide biosynthesis protein PslG